MNNDMLKLYKYLSEKHPESADQIFYGVTLVQQYLEKSVDDLKNDMKRAIDEGDYKSISCYFDLVKDIKSSYDMLLQEMAQISKEMEPIKELDTMPGQQVLDEALLGNNGNWLSIDSDFTSKKIVSLKVGKKEYPVSSMTEAYIKIFECFYSIDSKKFEKMLAEPFISKYTPTRLSRYAVSERSQKMQNADIYVWKNLSNDDKRNTIIELLKYFGYTLDFVKIAVNPNYEPTPRTINKKIDNKPKNSAEGIGKYVQSKMRILSESGFAFTSDMLHALTSKELTKKVVGVNYALLVTIKDYESGNVDKHKYWKDPMRFNGNMYYVTSQWYEYQREGFDKWYKGLKTTI